MNSIKINNARQKKRDSEKVSMSWRSLTPPRCVQKKTVYSTVARMERRFGYQFQNQEVQLCQTLKDQRQEFHGKAVKYCGGFTFCKKQTRFDKMRMKESLGFRLEELPIKKVYRRIDQMLAKELKRDALLALMRNK